MRPRSKPNRILVAFKTIQLFAFYLIPFWLLSHSKKKKNIPNIVIEVCCMAGWGVSLSFLLQAKCQHGSIVTDKCMKYRFKVGLFLFFLSRHKPIRRKQVAITNLLLCVCVPDLCCLPSHFHVYTENGIVWLSIGFHMKCIGCS